MPKIYNLTDTWNDGTTVFDAIKINVADTASAAGSKLLDLQIGGTSKFKVDKGGNVTLAGSITGLDQVDNTSDLDKPISTLTQAAIDAAGGGAFSADANTLITASTPIVLDEAIGDETALTLSYTTNKATSGNDTGLLINQTDTLSPGTSNLLDLQVGGVSKATASAAGDIDIAGSYKKEGNTILDYDSTLFNASVGGGALSGALLTGTGNSAMGYAALAANTDGNYNVATGNEALLSNVSGDYNVASGYRSLYANTSGVTNLALSREALRFNTTGNYNVAAGYRALYENVGGSDNVALGRQALLANVSGTSNAAVGNAAMHGNVSGVRNSALGYVSLYGLISGDNNVAVGSSAGRYQADGVTALTTADSSIFIGKDTRGVDAATNQIVIGDTAIGLGSNTVVLGADSIVTTALKGNVGIGTTAPVEKLDVAGTIAQRNGVNPQTFNIYNTYTDASNYERGFMKWNSNALEIGTEAGSGGGTVRPMEVAAPYLTLKQGADVSQYTPSGFRIEGFDDVSNRFLLMGVKSNGRGLLFSSMDWIYASNLIPNGLNRSGSLGASGNIWGSIWAAEVNIDQGTLTDDAQALNITSTWNDAADTFTLIKADVTDTASAAGSNLLDLQVGGVSQFGVDSGGNVSVSGSIAATGTIKTTPTTVGALPAAATAGAGARTFVTDSANSLASHHGQTVSGGGANFSPVYSDGTTWKVG